jgi:hypothetical protein
MTVSENSNRAGAAATLVIDLQRLAERLSIEQRRPLTEADVHQWLNQAGFSLISSAQGRRWSCDIESLSALQASEVLERTFAEDVGGVKFRRTEMLDPGIGVAGPPTRLLVRIDVEKFAARISQLVARDPQRLLLAAGGVRHSAGDEVWDLPRAVLAVLHPGEYSMIDRQGEAPGSPAGAHRQ